MDTITARRQTHPFPAGVLLKGRTMANDRSKDRLERIRKTPFFKIEPSGIDWYSEPSRPAVADRNTWLHTWLAYDQPIIKAFDYFGLDPSDPRHWKVLIAYLAFAFFPNGKKDGKASLETLLENAKLLKRTREILKAKNDTELLRVIIKKFPKDYSEKQIPNLRKKLNAARKAEGLR